MSVHIDGPVGRRWNQVNVQNSQQDQQRIIGLLSRISVTNGGKKEEWPAPILPGADGDCSPYLLSAIWDFQKFWLARGLFHNIDGVVDPEGHTLFRMNLMAEGANPAPDPVRPKPSVQNRRASGTWQVTNIWSVALGEVGMVGGSTVEIAQPDDKKFEIIGWGAGAGYGIDPITLSKVLKEGLKALNPFADVAKFALGKLLESVAKGVGFSLGDYYQLFGGSLSSVTSGVLIPNPINQYVGRPTVVSRYLMTEAGRANYAIASAGGGILAGAECGLMGFGGPAIGPSMLFCPVLGYYGTAGATWKIGGSAQVMLYQMADVREIKTPVMMMEPL